MCGIAGISQVQSVDRNVLAAAVASMRHRGPDSQGTFLSGDQRVGLAHARLAILDTSDAGHQPMTYAASGATITYNGEIYNHRELRSILNAAGHRFRSNSDTETLLAGYLEWGEGVLDRVQGIFAFAIYDARNATLFVARDQLGVKPLYYSASDGCFAFASEIKTLMKLTKIDASIDHVAIARYVAFLWSPGEATPLSSVKKLAPGSALLVREGKVERYWSYWTPPIYNPRLDWGQQDCKEAVAAAVSAAVRRQMISDVPVGAFLSGGLDSTAVVAAARNMTSDIKCFTIDTGGESEADTKDLPFARSAAAALGVELYEIAISPQLMCDEVANMVYALDEPLADPASLNVLFISRLARQHGIKVLLSGAGGDDVFSGYRRHQALALLGYTDWLPQYLRAGAVSALRRAQTTGPRARRLSRLASLAALDRPDRIVGSFLWTPLADAVALMSPDCRRTVTAELVTEPLDDTLAGHELEPEVERCLVVEKRHFLADHNLIYTDKMAMAAGVEVRVPLLDSEIVTLAAQIPVKWKIRGGSTKWIFKESQRGIIPDAVIDRPKAGFGAPLREWMANGLKDLTEEFLSAAVLENRGLFDVNAVADLRMKTGAGIVDGTYTLFSLMCIEMWCRRFVDDPQTGQSRHTNAVAT